MGPRFFKILAAIVVPILVAIIGYLGTRAPTEYANIEGQIINEWGQPIPDAQVDLKYKDFLGLITRGRETTSDNNGNFIFDGLRKGKYTVVTTKDSWKYEKQLLLTEEVVPLKIIYDYDYHFLYVYSNRSQAKSFASLLGKHNLSIYLLECTNLADISSIRFRSLIVGSDTGRCWKENWGSLDLNIRSIMKKAKVIGLGVGGCELFEKFNSDIGGGSGWHGRETRVYINFLDLLEGPEVIHSEDKLIKIYEQTHHVGISDQGSPLHVLGLKGLGRESRDKHHWPIIQEGNRILWGFTEAPSRMTDNGKKLFINLCGYQLRRKFVQYEKPPKQYSEEGLYRDTVGGEFTSNKYFFKVSKVGNIKARLIWQGPPLSLMLNPVGEHIRARQDGRSPLEIEYDVQEGDLSDIEEWYVSVTNFGQGEIPYRLSLSYPHR